MTQLLVVILEETTQLPELLEAWQEIGLPGATVLDGAGGYRAQHWLERVGLGAIGDLFSSEDLKSKMVLSVIKDEEMLERAIVEAERVVGDFKRPGAGLLFTIPVSRSMGIRKPEAEEIERARPGAKRREALSEAESVTRNTSVRVIDEILNLKPVIVQQSQSLMEVATAMVEQPGCVSVACVVNDKQRLVGLITLQSLVDDLFMIVVPEEFLSEARDLEDAMHFAKLSASEIAEDAMMEPIWVKEEETMKVAFRKMHDNKLPGVPIVNDHYEVTGYISLLELLAVYARSQKLIDSQENSTDA